ncbi:hypothetical protein SAMN04487948_12314 [Halogranum amylolyticum]|uniref:Uncharacterized protein n=1 Tax=Halogranum amylolyticum TaxID=660520 RepID=A0A1H8W5Q9_9EURY|nr:hypothetical protein [Halogranum amylolyticum]SEP22478.1 hypothetical protein SAMN04487948_12314 [Halogranum amylolyticum]
MTRKLLIGLALLGITLAALGIAARRVAAPADDDTDTATDDRIDFETATASVEG